jgi:hypothetical protein
LQNIKKMCLLTFEELRAVISTLSGGFLPNAGGGCGL